jgi:thymidylate synthase
VVKNPLKEPRIHAGDVIGQQSLKSGYIDEILNGTKDFYVEKSKWDYTYHERLVKYTVPSLPPIDQLNQIVETLKKGELYSRRLQAVTWKAWKDPDLGSPPCFQRIWFTVPTVDLKPKHGMSYKINFQTCWRSRDLFDAWGANVNAMVELCKEKIVKPLNEVFQSSEVKFEVGQYVDFSNDLHIYEKDFKQVKEFVAILKKKLALGKSHEEVRMGPDIQTLINLGKFT